MAKASKKVAKKATVKKVAKKAVKKVAKKAPAASPKKSAKKTAPKKTAPKKATPKKVAKKAAKAPERQSGKKFLIIYHAPMEAVMQSANVTPEERATGLDVWNAWAAKVGSRLLDLGAPLINGKRLQQDGSVNVSSKEVTGYSLLQADDWDEIMQLLEGHPYLSGWHPEAAIEIHETMYLPGM